MTEASNCVDAAIQFANGKLSDGKSYRLRVVLKNREVVEGTVSRMADQHPHILFLLVDKGEFGTPIEVFIDKTTVVTASLLW